MALLQKISALHLQLAAVFTVLAFPIGVLAARMEMIHFRFSFLIFIIAALMGFVILILSLLKLAKGADGEGKPLMVAVVFTLMPLIALGLNIAKAKQHPFIHDVSTDLENIPAFEAVIAARTAEDHSTDHQGEKISAKQKAGYPDLKPLLTEVAPEEVLKTVNLLISDLNWESIAVHSTAMPYRVEAVDTTFLFRFKDDVVVRIDQQPDGMTLVDMRSMSRQGESDLGVNAKRIEMFLSKLAKRLK